MLLCLNNIQTRQTAQYKVAKSTDELNDYLRAWHSPARSRFVAMATKCRRSSLGTKLQNI